MIFPFFFIFGTVKPLSYPRTKMPLNWKNSNLKPRYNGFKVVYNTKSDKIDLFFKISLTVITRKSNVQYQSAMTFVDFKLKTKVVLRQFS